MGNTQRPCRSSAEFQSASRSFSESELEDLKKLYDKLSSQVGDDEKFVSVSAFQHYFGIHGSVGVRLYDLVTQKRKDNRLHFEDLIIAKAAYENGSPSEIDDFIFQLLDLNGDDEVTRTDWEGVIMFTLKTLRIVDDPSSNSEIADDFLNVAEFSEQSKGDGEPCMSRQDFRKSCSLIPSLRKFLGSLLAPPPANIVGRQVPRLVVPVECPTLLQKEHAWHISGVLQPHEVQEWELLYHSSINGLSFNTFLNNVTGVQGSTILVIKDKEGCVYGGYASHPWEKHSDFYGDMKCFLFTLHPKIALYRATGSNTNLQWSAVNYKSESIPNGIGFGGQIHHFGLFLSSSFDRGHTRYSVTFNNPALSTTEAFVPDTVECWAVVVNGPDGGASKLKGTILERFKEDRQMLNMVGLANASESGG